MSAAGMRYAIFTTKHHDGFCLFDSDLTDFIIAIGPFASNQKKDLARHVFRVGYTLFSYSDLRILPDGTDSWKVTCRITNTGEREGTETVQLYVGDVKATVSQPERLLKGFERIKIRPGESGEVSFPLGFNELAIYDRKLNRIVEPGDFRIGIGASSADLRLESTLTVLRNP